MFFTGLLAAHRLSYFGLELNFSTISYTFSSATSSFITETKIKNKTFNALEFLAQLVSHIPNRGEQIIRFYGVYSNAYKGKANNLTEVEIIEAAEKRRKNKYRARLIQKLFLTRPLQIYLNFADLLR